VAQLYPQELGTHFGRLYDMHGLHLVYSLIPATTRDICLLYKEIFSPHMFRTFENLQGLSHSLFRPTVKERHERF
jgi:hypothetical protein